MTNDRIIEPVTQPTEWCHQMTLATKPDGSVRVCLDPRNLNKYLERAVFPFPDLDQVFTKIQGATHLSKIDLKSGFWNIRLDEE